MKEFLLIFRRDESFDQQLSPEQMKSVSQPWQEWMAALSVQNKLVDAGNRLAASGKVVRPNGVVTNGPFVETKETVGGFTIIRAASIDEATELSKSCPILPGGNVEVREIIPMD